MKKIASENIPFLIGFLAMALALIIFLMYRNLKDEEEFEHNLDDPKQDLEKHHHGDTE